MGWIDIGIICAVILGFLIGIYGGFFKSFMSLAAFIIAGVIAFFLMGVISGLLETMFGLQSSIQAALAAQIEGMDAALGTVTGSTIEELIALVSGSTGIDGLLKTIILNYMSGIVLTEPTTVSALVSGYLAGFVISIISFFVIFLIVRALLQIVIVLVKRSINESSALATVDQVLGGVVGAAKMVLWVGVGLSVLVVLSKLPVMDGFIISAVEGNAITEWGFGIINGWLGF